MFLLPANTFLKKAALWLIVLFFGASPFASTAIAENKMAAEKGAKKETGAQEAAPSEEKVAEIVACSTDIYYRWQPTQTSGSSAQAPEPVREVFYAAVLLSAIDETEAKRLVQREAIKESQKATALCAQTHEQKSKCYAQKFQAVQADYLQANYAVRKLITTSIEADCLALSGSCLGVSQKRSTCWREQ